MATKRATEPLVQIVQIEGLVALKLIKHAQEEGAGGTDLVHGVLLGLLVENKLEITNCFPFPKSSDDDETGDSAYLQYQMEMMRNLRHVNVDHLHVGWYQSTYFGSFINKTLLESQFNYQHSIEESVVLIYDPLRTAQGFLSLKAYRMTPAMMKFYKECYNDYTAENLTKHGINFQSIFEEIPIVLKNSHLVNALMCELGDMTRKEQKYTSLDLGTSSMLEKNLRQLMECVDDVSMDTNKYLNHQRNVFRQKQAMQQYTIKREQENHQRKTRGEPPLPEEDMNKMFKPLPPQQRLECTLVAGQMDNYCKQVCEFASQSLGKLFMAETIHEDNAQS